MSVELSGDIETSFSVDGDGKTFSNLTFSKLFSWPQSNAVHLLWLGLRWFYFIQLFFLSFLSPRVRLPGEKLQQWSNAAAPAAARKAWRGSWLWIGNVNTNWSWIRLNLSLSCLLTHASVTCTLPALNSALNWKQYWAPGLQNEFVYDYSCPGALRAPGNAYFIELGGILFSSPLQFMSVLAKGRILIEMVWLSYKSSITYRFRQPQGWPANAAAGKTWSD